MTLSSDQIFKLDLTIKPITTLVYGVNHGLFFFTGLLLVPKMGIGKSCDQVNSQ